MVGRYRYRYCAQLGPLTQKKGRNKKKRSKHITIRKNPERRLEKNETKKIYVDLSKPGPSPRPERRDDSSALQPHPRYSPIFCLRLSKIEEIGKRLVYITVH